MSTPAKPLVPVDLHCHSRVSDGTLPPEEVVQRAAERGCRLLALTDHDDVRGLPAARLAASQYPDLRLLAGVEISVTWREKHTLHILGLDVDDTHPDLVAGLVQVRSGRAERAERIAAALHKVGVEGALEGAQKFVTNPELVSRTHFARFIIERGLARDMQAVFKKYLAKGKPGYVAHQWATLPDAVSWIKAAGGVAVLAHPGRYDFGKAAMRDLLHEFIDLGGEGIEVVSPSHAGAEVAAYGRLANEFGLLASAGSDFHTPEESWRAIGLQPELPLGCTPVWSRWLS